MDRPRNPDGLLLCVAAAAILAAPGAGAQTQSTAARHREAAIELLRNGDAQASLTEIHKALALDPNDAASHDVLGVVLGESGQVSASLLEFREAIRMDPDAAEAHFHLGLALERTGSPRDAIPVYEHALLLSPELLEARYGLSSACAGVGDLSGAIALLRDVVDALPQLGEARLNLGLNLWNRYKRSTGSRPKKDLDQVREELRRAVDLAQRDAAFHAALGQFLSETQDLDAAVAQLREAAALAPDRAEEATRELREAIRLDPAMTEARVTLAQTLARAGRMAEAREQQAEVRRINAEDADHGRALVLLQTAADRIQRGEVTPAIDDLREAAALNPRFAETH